MSNRKTSELGDVTFGGSILAKFVDLSQAADTDKDRKGTLAALQAYLLAQITGTTSGKIPVLDGSGLLATSVLPPLAITKPNVVASQSAMLALTAEQGDIAIRTDLNKSFILSTNSPSTLADWKELLTPTDAVLSVAGLTGAISALALRTALSLVVGTDVRAAFHGASVSRSAAQSTTALAATTIGWDTEAFDTDSIHDNVTNNSRLTVPSGFTRAQLTLNGEWATGGGGYRIMWIKKNGSIVAGDCRGPIYESYASVVTPFLPVTAGDYFEAVVQQDSGGALNFGNTTSRFSIELLP